MIQQLAHVSFSNLSLMNFFVKIFVTFQCTELRLRFDDKDVQLAKLAAKNLFSGDLGGRVFIVVTHSEICHNLDEQWVWLMENAGMQFNRTFGI